MNGKTMLRWGMLLAAVFLMGLTVKTVLQENPQGETCMGVEILSQEEMAEIGTYTHRDYSKYLRVGEELAAVDRDRAVIYISQKIDETTRGRDLSGKLSLDIPGRKLSFAPDENWEDLSNAVRTGHGFQLLISDFQNTYMRYDVVFTTLPVISLQGDVWYRDSEARNVMAGKFTLWDPEADGRYSDPVQTSRVNFKVRGRSTRNMEKSPWKLSMKSWDGGNRNLDLLGMGSDDDWILNSMCMDDCKVREKLFMDLWNEMAAGTDYDDPMSQGKYVEVLLNGSYSGLYLLQRRVDAKYLKLDTDQVLVKVSFEGDDLFYDFSSPSGRTVDRETLSSIFRSQNYADFDKENFIDVNLFLQAFSAVDNCYFNNMYYLFQFSGEDISVRMVPWDTDMSLGLIWSEELDGFDYRYDYSLKANMYRTETEGMIALHPGLYQDFRTRWFELRETVLDQELVFAYLDAYLAQLKTSGADVRDVERWGLVYGGEDTVEELYRYIEDRFASLDLYFAEESRAFSEDISRFILELQ